MNLTKIAISVDVSGDYYGGDDTRYQALLLRGIKAVVSNSADLLANHRLIVTLQAFMYVYVIFLQRERLATGVFSCETCYDSGTQTL